MVKNRKDGESVRPEKRRKNSQHLHFYDECMKVLRKVSGGGRAKNKQEPLTIPVDDIFNLLINCYGIVVF
ncbi:hypothetical protein [Cronobacter dublinensis]|uniref:hypothetical protein n=1 Tax=Cronobacter dublinensis TaxID=413497 RepID=UPI00300DFBAA